MRDRFRFRARALASFLLLPALIAGFATAQQDPDLATATRLADHLRAARSVVSAHQPVINDPAIGDKNLGGATFLAMTEAAYEERTGKALTAGPTDRDRDLIAAQREAIRITVDSYQDTINEAGVGFKGFIPAVFARLTNEEFERLAGDVARVRVTAPLDLIRNRRARPDDWETRVIADKLRTDDWPKGAAFAEITEFEGRPAFRILFPEYYRESCLACHGGPKGETDVTGYLKEGGKAGEFAGAISIVLFK